MCGACEIITTPDRLPDTMYLSWGGDTLDAGGGITLMRDARSRSGAELLAEEERRSLRRTELNLLDPRALRRGGVITHVAPRSGVAWVGVGRG